MLIVIIFMLRLWWGCVLICWWYDWRGIGVDGVINNVGGGLFGVLSMEGLFCVDWLGFVDTVVIVKAQSSH